MGGAFAISALRWRRLRCGKSFFASKTANESRRFCCDDRGSFYMNLSTIYHAVLCLRHFPSTVQLSVIVTRSIYDIVHICEEEEY